MKSSLVDDIAVPRGGFLRASLGLQRTFAGSSSLVPHDDIAHVACYLIDYEQLHRSIGEADSSVTLSDPFDDEVAGPIDVTAALSVLVTRRVPART